MVEKGFLAPLSFPVLLSFSLSLPFSFFYHPQSCSLSLFLSLPFSLFYHSLSCSLSSFLSLSFSSTRASAHNVPKDKIPSPGYTALLVSTSWHRCIQFIDINLFLMSSEASEFASEKTNERDGARQRCRQYGAREWGSGVRAKEWTEMRMAHNSPRQFHMFLLEASWIPVQRECLTNQLKPVNENIFPS